MIFVIRGLQEQARKKRIPLHVCFIDLTKAYDSVDQTLLWTVLARFGEPQNMISVIHQFHDGMRTCVRFDNSGTRPSTREGDTGVDRHIQRRGNGLGVQPDERVYIPRGGRQPQCRSIHRRRPAHTQRIVQLPEVHPRDVRLTVRYPRAQNRDAKSRCTRDNAVRLRHVEPARLPLRHTALSPPQVRDSLHRLAKAQSRRPPDFLPGHAYQDGK